MQQVARRAATAVAALRVVLGAVAAARPDLAARPWVGRTTQDAAAAVVLGRAAGARDIALGAGLLASAGRGDSRATADWTRAGVFSDLSDLVITLASWRRLPRTRLLVAVASGGAALVGAAATARPRQVTSGT